MKWTPMQEKAVFEPVKDILVTAAAGSGKTQVLTGRILNRLAHEKADISRLLVITFTNAAAAEMKSRISKKISEAVAENPKDKHLRRQAALIGSADISTIHGFCNKILRSYFYIPDIDPSFKIAEGYDTSIMKVEALSDAMDFFYDSEDESFLAAVDLLCGAKSDTAISDMADKVWRFSESEPFPDVWLSETKEKYINIRENFPVYADILINKSTALLKKAHCRLKRCIEIIKSVPEYEEKADIFEEDANYIASLLSETPEWDVLLGASEYKLQSNLRKFSKADPEFKEELKEQLEAAKKDLKAVSGYINMPYDDALSYSESMINAVSVIISLAEKAEELYVLKKKEKNLLDYGDLEHLTIKILASKDDDGNLIPSVAAKEIRDKYDEIYVDEYQDTNDVQETILKLISGETKDKPNLFMVGDMKQSIYKFRMTNPKKIFGQKASSFTDVNSANPEDRHIKIALSLNFRSRREILDSINSVFDLLMSDKAGEVEYTGDERLSCGSTCYTEDLEIPACRFTILATNTPTNKSQSMINESGYIAEKITSLVEKGVRVYDKDIDGFRPISYKDIVILLRAPGPNGYWFEDALKKRNIPVYSDVDSSLFECSEISLLLSFLRIIDNPLQDISLISVLRSPIFSFSENTLASLALRKKEHLYYALKEAAFSEENPDKRCFYFIKKLEKWREDASLMSVSDFLSSLIRDTHFTSYVSAMPDSESHLTNLSLLVTMAKKSDESSHKGLFNFLQYLDKMYLSGENSAASLSDSLDAVRIMSIHRSKGLEFPVVFLAYAEGKFSNKDYTGSLLLHKDMGLGISAYTNNREKFKLPVNLAIAEAIKDECVSEELRVLYVALTRAREHLDIVSSAKFSPDCDHYVLPEAPEEITPDYVLQCSSYFDWLLLAAKDNKNISLNIINNPSFDCEEVEIPNYKIPEPIQCTNDIASVLDYQYPSLHLKSVKSKYSVSELKAAHTEDNSASLLINSRSYNSSLRLPSFLNSDKVFTSAEKGSIIHYILEKYDYFGDSVEENFSKMNLTEDELNAVDISELKKFFEGPLCRRLKNAEALHREEPFTFTKNLSEITKNPDDDTTVLIQGIIDCYFIEDDSIILLDYKTDRNVNPDILKERYEMQLSVYAEALEKRYNIPVKEKLIYSFSLNEVIHI